MTDRNLIYVWLVLLTLCHSALFCMLEKRIAVLEHAIDEAISLTVRDE